MYEIDQGTGSTHLQHGRSLRVIDIYETTLATSLPIGYESTAQKAATSTSVSQPTRGQDAQMHERRRINPSVRDAIRRALIDTENLSSQMADCAANSRLIDLANLGFQLQDTLQDLWKWRNEREDDWGDLLNLIQSALAQEEFEKFSAAQCEALHKVLTEYLAVEAVDEDDLSSAATVLRDVGFDPWKTISRNEVTEDEDD